MSRTPRSSGSQTRRVVQRTVYATPDFWAWLDAECARAGVSRNQYVQTACKAWAQNQGEQ